MTEPDRGELVARMEALERRNVTLLAQIRKTRLLAISTVGLVALCGLLAAQPDSPKTVKSQTFVLVDSKGRERAIWGIDEKDGPGIVLFDKEHRKRFTLGLVNEAYPAILLYDPNQRPRAAIALRDDGPMIRLEGDHERSHIALSCERNKRSTISSESLIIGDGGIARIALAVGKKGPYIRLLDEKTRTRAELLATQTGSGLALFDPEEQQRALFFQDDDDAVLIVEGKNKKAGVQVYVKKNAPRIEILDENGKEVFSRP